MFALIAASCTVQPPEADELGQSEAALATGWQGTTQMPEQRRYHSATVLASDKVLVVGGWSYNDMVAKAVTYDPASATWSPAGTLAVAREAHTATRLSSGKVLVVGGELSTPYPNNYTNTAELYDPATNSWSSAGTTSQARGYNTATLLSTTPEKVLVVGGLGGGPQQTVDLYNTTTGTWSTAASLLEPRWGHTAVRLASGPASGKVLVAGGWGGKALWTTELYDPATNTWTAGPHLLTARYGHTLTELPNGKILVVGGQKDNPSDAGDFTATAELYDPSTQTWSPAGNLGSARGFHTATLVAGKVLVAGGKGQGNVTLATAEVYDPATNMWSSTSAMLGARSDHTAVYSNSLGKVLVIGGSNNSALATAEVYDSCDLITCNTAPGSCYLATGTCSKGTCSYAPKSAGSLCDDSNACTTGDTCNGAGACSGNQLSCSTASNYYCSGNDVRKTTGTGSCSAGLCGSTDSFVQTCSTGTSSPYCSGNSVYQTANSGCSGGACASTQQLVQTCSTASSYFCSGNQRWLSAGTGCSGGSCRSSTSYVETCSTGSSDYCYGNQHWRTTGYGCRGDSCDSSDDYLETCSTGTSRSCIGNTLKTSTGNGCSSSSGSCSSTDSFVTCPVGTTVTCTITPPQINGSGFPTTIKGFVSTRTDSSGCSTDHCVSTSTADKCENQEECSGNSACTTLNLDNNSDFLKVSYRDVLKREPDSAGLAFWLDAMNNALASCGGTTDCKWSVRATMVQEALLESPEGVSIHPGLTGDRCADSYKTAYVTALYNDLLQRASLDGGLAFWKGALTNCNSSLSSDNVNSPTQLYKKLAHDFIVSPPYEYQGRWGRQGL